MSRWLARAMEIEKEKQSSVRHLTKSDKNPPHQPMGGFCRVLSNCHIEEEGEIQRVSAPDFKHGFAVNRYPKTWTGKIVSLEEWRRLSAWERHGPDGRFWNGKTRRWEFADD